MKYAVVIAPQALADLEALRVYDRRKVTAAIEELLTTNPTQVSRTRIKHLRGMESPEFRLRVNGFRILYDVQENQVHVLRVLPKAAVEEYLREMGYEAENG